MRGKSYNILTKVLRSNVKINILETLSSNPLTRDEMIKILKLSKNTLRINLRELMELNLIEMRNDNRYIPTVKGRIITANFKNSIKNLATIEKFKNFFETHYIDAIPDEYLYKIGNLWECELIVDTDEDLFRVYKNFLKILEESVYIYGVAPILSEGYVESIYKTLKMKEEVNLVITRQVFDKLSKEYKKQLENALTTNFSIRISKEDIKLGLTVTDKYLSFGLYTKDGKRYDPNVDLVGSSKEALSWGMGLFKYYWNRSIPLEEYL